MYVVATTTKKMIDNDVLFVTTCVHAAMHSVIGACTLAALLFNWYQRELAMQAMYANTIFMLVCELLLVCVNAYVLIDMRARRRAASASASESIVMVQIMSDNALYGR